MINRDLEKLVPSGIRKFTALAAAKADCLALTIGEPEFDTPAPIVAAAQRALDAGMTHYAPNRGTDSLRRAIAAYETNRGMACGPENILVTIGATGALYTALTGLLNPEDQVIIPTPAFSLYESITLAAGAEPVFLNLAETGFQIHPEALAKAITPRTKAIILNSPNNPTGTVLNRDSLDAVTRAVAGRDIYLICDNVYAALSERELPDLTREPALRDRVILCQSFSKPWAMTGWRIGYLAAPEALVEKFLLLQAAQIASVPTFVQAAAEAALAYDPAPMAQVYARRRELVCRRLREMGLSFPRPEGAFYVFPDIVKFGLGSEAFCARLITEGGVACVPGACFAGEGHIRISCCCGDETLIRGLDRLEAFIHRL